MALVALLVASLINCRPLRNAVVMATPHNVGSIWEAENPLHSFPGRVSVLRYKFEPRDSPDLNVASAIVLGPYAEDIFTTSDAQDDAADFLARLHELISNKRH